MPTSETMKNNQLNLRDVMKDMLSQCTPEQQEFFGKMYNHEGKHENHVDGVKDSQLDHAFYQIENTLKKNAAKEKLQ